MLRVNMVIFAWLEETAVRDVWRSALEDAGELYAMIDGMKQTLPLLANNLGSVLKVRIILRRNNELNHSLSHTITS